MHTNYEATENATTTLSSDQKRGSIGKRGDEVGTGKELRGPPGTTTITAAAAGEEGRVLRVSSKMTATGRPPRLNLQVSLKSVVFISLWNLSLLLSPFFPSQVCHMQISTYFLIPTSL